MQVEVEPVTEDAGIDSCFAVMVELRPHLDRGSFVEQVRRLMDQGYRLARVRDGEQVVAVAGYRVGENLAWGRFLYVDDLVTSARQRSRGHGRLLFDWLVDQARVAGCDQFHLDSGVQRFGAHRFYLERRMDITSHHFALTL